MAPARLHQVSGLSSWRSWGCLLGVGSSRIAVLEGPVSPQDEVGRLWMDRYTWPGRGLQAGNVTGIIAGRKGKGQRGQVGYSTYVQVMVVLLDTTQSHKEWWSGAQLHPLVLCLSVTSHSCSEESGPHHLHFQVFSPLQITCTVVSESLATALWNGEGDGTHSSALAWRVPGTAEPGGLQSMGSLGVGHD